MRSKKPVQFGLCLLGFSPLMVLGAAPSTQPVADDGVLRTEVQTVPTPSADAGTGNLDETRPRGPTGRGRNGQRFQQQEYSPNDIAAAMQFYHDNSPQRFDAINAQPDIAKKNGYKMVATSNYLRWSQIGTEHPDLYQVIKDRVKVEDDIFGLVTQLGKAPPDAKDKINSQLRDKVGALVDLGIHERKIRLDLLAQALAKQQQQLTDDSAHRSDLVDERLKTILKEENGLLPKNNPGNGNGGGAPQRNHSGTH